MYNRGFFLLLLCLLFPVLVSDLNLMVVGMLLPFQSILLFLNIYSFQLKFNGCWNASVRICSTNWRIDGSFYIYLSYAEG